MAISNQIFNAPTGKTYNPSDRIERSLSGLGDSVAGAITNESNRLQQEQANFGEMYANLGEIDAQLQENYAGIMQEAVTSTRDWLKDKYKSGVNSNDPEFIRELSQRTSRIKAGMGNADRRREEVQQIGELIKNDPNIVDKYQALNYALSKSNDPDFLISRNNTSLLDEVVGKFESPKLVVDNFFKTIGTDGIDETDFTGNDGSLKRREIAYNRFIPRDNPTLEDGSPNIQVSLDDAKELMSGKYGQSMLRVTDNIRKERYPNDPVDLGYQKAMKDALLLSAGNNVKTRTIKSAYDIEQDRIRNNEAQQRINLARSRENRATQGGDEGVPDDRYSKFKEDFEQGKGIILGDYEVPGGNIKNIKWKVNPAVDALSSYDKWKSLSEEGKKELLSQLGVEDENIPKKEREFFDWNTWSGNAKDLDSEDLYDLAKKELEGTNTPKYTGISFERKGGTSKGSQIWEPEEVEITNEDDLKNVFKRFENTRVSGKGTKPVAEVPEGEDDKDLTKLF